jgi:DNA-binding transcriptional LysR family regulator
VLKRTRALINMPAVAATFYARAYDLVVSPPPLPSPDFEVSLAWHARTDADPAQAWFRGVVADEVANLRAQVVPPLEALTVPADRSAARS